MSARPTSLAADHGDVDGVDTGLMASAGGRPRAVPVIRVPSLLDAAVEVERADGCVVVPAFTTCGVGRGCDVTDPAGVLFGLHEYDAGA